MVTNVSVFIKGEKTFTRCVCFSIDEVKKMYSAFRIPQEICVVEDTYNDYGELLFSRSSVRRAMEKQWTDYDYNIREVKMKRIVTITLRHDLDSRNYKELIEGLADECNSHDASCPAGAFRCPFPGKVCTEVTPDDWLRVTDLKEVPNEEA